MIPDKIYMPNELLSEEWTTHIDGDDIEYIRKDALLEWLKEQQNEALRYNGGFITGTGFYQALIDKINSM